MRIWPSKPMSLQAVLTVMAMSWLVPAESPKVSAQVSGQSGAYLFRVKLTPKTTYKYSMRISTKWSGSPGEEQSIEMPFRWEIISVRGDTAEMKMVYEPMGDAKTSAIPAVPLHMDTRGKLTKASDGQRFNFGVAFPPAALKQGDSFKNAVPVTNPAFSGTSNELYTFNGMKTVDGRQFAELKVTAELKSTKASGGGSGTLIIDAADGYISTYTYTQTIKLTVNGEAGTLTQTLTVRRR